MPKKVAKKAPAKKVVKKKAAKKATSATKPEAKKSKGGLHSGPPGLR